MRIPLSVLCLAALLAVSGVVHAGGTDFTPFGTQPGLAASLDEPEACQSCHGALFSPAEGSYMPHATWSGSMMANALRDPLFWAALDVAETDAPGVGDFCLRCHTPVGWLGGRVRKVGGGGGTVNGTNGCLLQGDHDDGDGPENDYAGVTCHLCHRMTPVGPLGQQAPRANANYWIDDSLSCGGFFGPCRHGPFDYATTPALTPPHGWVQSSFTVSSDHCGTCHDVSSPTLAGGAPFRTLKRADGSDTGRAFPAERTFGEWRQSRYADVLLADSLEDGAPAVANVRVVPCQECHMRRSGDVQARACTGNPNGSRRGTLGVHEFVGGNTWVVRLVDRLYGGPSGLDRAEAFARTTAWALEILQQRTANVTVSLDPWTPGNVLRARVVVVNRAGHKFPTGYGEGRRAWLHVQARDANGNVFFESGAWNASTGALASDPQLRIYETLQGTWDAGTGTCRTTDGTGRKQFHFVLNDCVAKDTRIPPEGFRPASPSDPQGEEMKPVGITFAQVAPGVLENVDRASYDIVVPAATPTPITVTATVRYQIASDDYVRFLRDTAVESGTPSENQMCGRDWNVGPADKSRGQFLYDLWLDPLNGRSPPVDVATATSATP